MSITRCSRRDLPRRIQTFEEQQHQRSHGEIQRSSWLQAVFAHETGEERDQGVGSGGCHKQFHFPDASLHRETRWRPERRGSRLSCRSWSDEGAAWKELQHLPWQLFYFSKTGWRPSAGQDLPLWNDQIEPKGFSERSQTQHLCGQRFVPWRVLPERKSCRCHLEGQETCVLFKHTVWCSRQSRRAKKAKSWHSHRCPVLASRVDLAISCGSIMQSEGGLRSGGSISYGPFLKATQPHRSSLSWTALASEDDQRPQQELLEEREDNILQDGLWIVWRVCLDCFKNWNVFHSLR